MRNWISLMPSVGSRPGIRHACLGTAVLAVAAVWALAEPERPVLPVASPDEPNAPALGAPDRDVFLGFAPEFSAPARRSPIEPELRLARQRPLAPRRRAAAPAPPTPAETLPHAAAVVGTAPLLLAPAPAQPVAPPVRSLAGGRPELISPYVAVPSPAVGPSRAASEPVRRVAQAPEPEPAPTPTPNRRTRQPGEAQPRDASELAPKASPRELAQRVLPLPAKSRGSGVESLPDPVVQRVLDALPESASSRAEQVLRQIFARAPAPDLIVAAPAASDAVLPASSVAPSLPAVVAAPIELVLPEVARAPAARAFGRAAALEHAPIHFAPLAVAVVPEPSTVLLLGLGLAALGVRRSR